MEQLTEWFASDTIGPGFESNLWHFWLNIYLLLTVCRKDESKEKEAGNGPYFRRIEEKELREKFKKGFFTSNKCRNKRGIERGEGERGGLEIGTSFLMNLKNVFERHFLINLEQSILTCARKVIFCNLTFKWPFLSSFYFGLFFLLLQLAENKWPL